MKNIYDFFRREKFVPLAQANLRLQSLAHELFWTEIVYQHSIAHGDAREIKRRSAHLRRLAAELVKLHRHAGILTSEAHQIEQQQRLRNMAAQITPLPSAESKQAQKIFKNNRPVQSEIS